MTRFTVTFEGTPPDPISVGDKLRIEGTVQVRSITADFIDITSLGREPEYALGETEIDLVSNHLKVERA